MKEFQSLVLKVNDSENRDSQRLYGFKACSDPMDYTTNKTTYSRKKSRNCFFDFKAEISNQNTGCRGIFSAETIRTFNKKSL